MALESYSPQTTIGELHDLLRLKAGIDNALESVLLMLKTEIDDALESVYQMSEQTDKDYTKQLKEICDYVYNLCKEHPDLCRFILWTVGGMITIPLLLEVAGFSLLGPVAGSLAAMWQSRIGNVAARSLFAWLQRTGMLPAKRRGTGALVGFAGYLWVEIQKVLPLDPGGGRQNNPGGGRQNNTAQAMMHLNPMYRGFAALRRALA
ncbi:hypothetical protein ABW21_db0200408 [Orbilia brochopaga]|nr:hypothetical protein ABW21_db0200408 [Drechslerella brochopaga]